MFRTLIILMAAAPLGGWAAEPPPGGLANAPVTIERQVFGSGTPGASGQEEAAQVGDTGAYHVPQYLPGYPTAATIWPRAVYVRCKSQRCDGYLITPEMGPGEYLFFIPTEDPK
ncbi:MAG: hypothetical protein RR283_09095 [Comamonas sp.]|uniref:hypothetical protein n=2 Tax=unclassified Comamonas TaxID=2638500 RepID=UPI000EB5AC10|nr:hypothetical protein [Comamonas sp. lk]